APTLPPTHPKPRPPLALVTLPHLIVLVNQTHPANPPHRGRHLRSHPALAPDGANVNFISPAGTREGWRMRTYERGVEAETLACGTGAVAAACAVQQWGLGTLPTTIWTRSGRTLEIRARQTANGSYDDVWLVGEARLV